jgi:outer membrane protein OmpA-like peptidoglycan-associated protein
MLKESPQSFIILVANTKDCGSDIENSNLAQKRLDAIRDYLTENGVVEDRISAIDNGKVYPFFYDSSNNKIDSRVDLLVIQF